MWNSRSVVSLALVTALTACAPLTVPAIEPAQTSPEPPMAGEDAYPVVEIVVTPPEELTRVAATVGAFKDADATQFWVDLTLSPYVTEPVIPVPTGTAEDVYVRASARMLGWAVTNAWYGLVDGNNVSVWAGGDPQDAERGYLEIFWSWPNSGYHGTFSTPTRHGPVRVTAELNNRLMLTAADGMLFYFDVPALQFVESLDVVVPTALPPPTWAPNPTPAPIPTAPPE